MRSVEKSYDLIKRWILSLAKAKELRTAGPTAGAVLRLHVFQELQEVYVLVLIFSVDAHMGLETHCSTKSQKSPSS